MIPLILLNLFKKTNYENKVSDIEGKIPSITDLATTIALNDAKNTIPTVNDM